MGFALVLASALGIALATTAFTGGGGGGTTLNGVLTSASTCGYGGTPCPTFVVHMKAVGVVPGPGQQGATGTATVVLGAKTTTTVCAVLAIKSVKGPVTDFAIHKGAAGKTGSTSIDFGKVTVSKTGGALGCNSKVSTAVIKAITSTPSAYYATVSTTAFPKGAVRGQL
jgi:hypothetical protein